MDVFLVVETAKVTRVYEIEARDLTDAEQRYRTDGVLLSETGPDLVDSVVRYRTTAAVNAE